MTNGKYLTIEGLVTLKIDISFLGSPLKTTDFKWMELRIERASGCPEGIVEEQDTRRIHNSGKISLRSALNPSDDLSSVFTDCKNQCDLLWESVNID